MKRIQSATYSKILMLIGLMLLLPGCDGGIFGTSDGSEIVADNNDSADPDTQNPENPDASVDGGETQPPVTEPDDSEDSSELQTTAFENLQTGSNNQLPAVSLFNLSNVALNARTAMNADPLFASAVQPGTISELASLALETTELSISIAASGESVLTLSPLNLGAFSVSTLIARDRFADAAPTTDSDNPLPGVEIIAIPSRQLTSDDGVARVRLIQAVALDDEDQIADMRLEPSDQLPGGSEVELGSLSAATFGLQPEYRIAAPGSYRLVDPLGRLPGLSVQLSEGQVHTLILAGKPVQLLDLQDSDVEDENATDGSR